jgi:hypothetical protein
VIAAPAGPPVRPSPLGPEAKVIHPTGARASSSPEQSPGGDHYPGATVFVAGAEAARALAAAPAPAVSAAIGEARAFVWMADGEPVARLRFGHDLRVSEDAVFACGPLRLRVGRGAVVREEGGETLLLPGGGGIDFGVEGGEAAPVDRVAVRDGRLELTAALAQGGAEVSMRYFYGQGASLAGIRYPVFGGALPARVDVSLDPARPDDPAANLLSAAASLATGFTTPLGGVVTLAPAGGALVQAWDPVAGEFYLTPDGPWQLGFAGLTGAGPQAGRLLLGLQGLEYARVRSGSTLRFAQGPAYAPGFGGTGPAGLTSTVPGAANPVRTAWVYPDASGPSGLPGLGYYAQPYAGSLFEPTATQYPQPFPTLPLLAGGFPPAAPGSAAPAFPAVPYAAAGPAGAVGPTGGWIDTLAAFEGSVLSPTRRGIVQALNAGAGGAGGPGSYACDGPVGPTAPSTPTGPGGSAQAVTQQGLVSTFADDGSSWNSILLARSGAAGASGAGPGLVLTEIGGTLRSALLANDLFLVVSDAAAFEGACSTTYQVTQDVLAAAQLQGVPGEAAANAARMQDTVYFGVDYFQCALKTALGPADYAAWGGTFTRLAESARLTISGWTFDLSPLRWTPFDPSPGAANAGTILVIKVCGRDLADVAGDPSYWTMPAEFNADPAATARALAQIVATSPDVGGFGAVRRDWNGILYLNCTVNTSELPPQLEGLAAGIPTPSFTAHHLGINLSPVMADAAGGLLLSESSMFAAIDYTNDDPLEYAGQPYAFRVSLLRVAFENSQIVSFASTLKLLVAELFLEPAVLNGGQGGILVFVGTWQKHGQTDAYAFTCQGENRFAMTSRVLDTVEVDAAQFVTVQANAQAAGGMTVTSRFVLSGSIAWRALPFDVFSFGPETAGAGGGLAYANLLISMQFPRMQPSSTTFAFLADQVGLVAPPGAARAESLYARMPLTVAAMLQGSSAAFPAALGYAPVSTPLDPGALGPQWFGLQLSLDLGSAGALAAAGGLAASLLLAWAPAAKAYNVGVGMHLPGAGSSGKTISIEGPLTLGVRTLALFPGAANDYLLRFGTITLGFFGVQFPRGGSTDLLLFGNPDPQRAATSLGWYAAYQPGGK